MEEHRRLYNVCRTAEREETTVGEQVSLFSILIKTFESACACVMFKT